jgi:hypothetical protein
VSRDEMKIYAACCRSATVLDENVFATDEMVLKAIMLAENLLPDPAHSAFYTRICRMKLAYPVNADTHYM